MSTTSSPHVHSRATSSPCFFLADPDCHQELFPILLFQHVLHVEGYQFSHSVGDTKSLLQSPQSEGRLLSGSGPAVCQQGDPAPF